MFSPVGLRNHQAQRNLPNDDTCLGQYGKETICFGVLGVKIATDVEGSSYRKDISLNLSIAYGLVSPLHYVSPLLVLALQLAF